MSDTPRTDAAITGSNGQWCFELRDVAREMERELNEANADRHRLREALTQAGAGQFLDTISATPPPTVDAKPDADALANALDEANADRHRLREALKACDKAFTKYDPDPDSRYGMAWDDVEQALTTPPPPVVAKADADALANALEKMEFSAHSHHDLPMCPKCLCIPAWGELHREDCLFNSLQTYRTKYP
jgi:hypothetical protein